MKYKLIKKYPGLSERIETEDEVELLRKGSTFYKSKSGVLVHFKFIENYPEFWEKIEEKEYEILSFINTSKVRFEADAFISKKGEDGLFNPSLSAVPNIKSTEEELLNNVNYQVYSIKRLSDNTIFTVGDKIMGTMSYLEKEQKYVTILEIIIYGNDLFLRIETGNVINKYGSFKNIKHYKIPIFTTEDGVDIFDGDMYYFTSKDSIGYIFSHKCVKTDKGSDCYIRFSTKEKAQEYINRKKILFVTRDGMNMHHSQQCYQININTGYLKLFTVGWDTYNSEKNYYFNSLITSQELSSLITQKRRLKELDSRINSILNAGN